MGIPVQVPPRFAEFTAGIRRAWGYREPLPQSEEEMFDHLAYWSLLSGITNSAQNEYLYLLIEPITHYRKVDDRWSIRAKKILEAEAGRISKSRKLAGPGSRRATNLKLDAIRKLLARRMEANRTFLEAQEAIPRMWLAEGNLGKWRRRDRVIDLVAAVAHPNGAYKIFDIGYIKGTKWIQACGVGQQVVPPMIQIAKFLAEMCGCSEFRKPEYEYKHLGGLDEVEMPQAIVDWGPMNTRCRELAKKAAPRWGTAQIVGDTIHVVMYVRGQVEDRKLARMVTPATLLSFLKSRRTGFRAFTDALYNVDTLPAVTSTLENYLGSH
jgi:hypothetical protein